MSSPLFIVSPVCFPWIKLDCCHKYISSLNIHSWFPWRYVTISVLMGSYDHWKTHQWPPAMENFKSSRAELQQESLAVGGCGPGGKWSFFSALLVCCSQALNRTHPPSSIGKMKYAWKKGRMNRVWPPNSRLWTWQQKCSFLPVVVSG